MLNNLIRWSLAHRGLVLGLAALVTALGITIAGRLPVEVLPDLTRPTVVVLTEAPGLSPEEVETRITRPLERALLGVQGLVRLRSNSDVALSLIFVEFDWNTDVYRNRLLVQERLQSVTDELPEGVRPGLTPVASLMGEILLVGVRSIVPPGEAGHRTPSDVREVADWMIRPQLLGLPGVAEVLSMGGGVKQIEVRPDPHRMQAHQVRFDDLESAVAQAARSTTGGFLDVGPTEVMIRNLAMTTDGGEIGRTVVRKTGDRPVTIADVAEIAWTIEPQRGDAALARAPEKASSPGVIMSVTKSPGVDTRALTARVKAALTAMEPGLPAGIETFVLFQQKDFIDHAIGNLNRAIVEAAVMVTVVLLLFLFNLRTTFITLMAIPTSFAITLGAFQIFGISVNSMTLGGLAVAVGMVVDDAIVDVENVLRRLRENAALATPQPRLAVIAQASGEVRSSIFYATLLIVLVFVPLLGLSGVEGRLFAPIAVATILSMAASFLVSLTLIPVLCSYLLHPRPDATHSDNVVVRGLKFLLRTTALRLALGAPFPVLALLAVALLAAVGLYAGMGRDFLPVFKEETALVAVTSAPGTSLAQMNTISAAVEEQILAVPEVRTVGRRVGRAERGDHVVPVSTAEFDIDFFHDPNSRPRGEILADIRRRVQSVPGIFAAVSGPLADRIGHMLSGVPAPIAVKISGPDLDELRRIGGEIHRIAKSIPGLEDARLDQQSTIPQLRIEPDRERSAAYGITPGALNDRLSALLGGRILGSLWDGERTLHLSLRLPPSWRDSPERIAALPIEVGGGRTVPLSAVAAVREARGPNVIFRENGRRQFTVAIKPTERDAGRLVEELARGVQSSVRIPEGYFVSYEGEFQARNDAARRILILSATVLAIIVFLLTSYFQSISLALQVLLNIPLALIGAVALTWLLIDNISIATLVGFIAVGGIAARNGIMMISHYLHLMKHEGETFCRAMVERGTQERMVPVLMTALAAGIALIPFVLAADQPGKEILHPVAVVIVGGLVSSTLLDFLITPLVFFHFARRSAHRALARGAAAAR